LSTNPIYIPIFGKDFYIDPPASFSIFGFSIHFYAIFIMLGFILAGIYMYVRRDAFGLTMDNVLDIIIRAVVFGIIGARIYYIIFNPSLYFGEGNWGNIIQLRSGGLAIYGGIIGAALSIIVYAYRKKLSIGRILDASAFGLFIGQIVGRWGNFINREAYGIETDLPWRMGIMTRQGIQYVHPIFLYESLWNVLGFIFLHVYSKKRKSGFPGQLVLIYFAWYGFGRFFIEGIRGPDALLIHDTDVPVSQVLAAVSCIIALGLLIFYQLKYRSPDLNVENLILEHSGPDYEQPPCDTETYDFKLIKRLRAINIAKGRRVAKEKQIEDTKNALKTKRIAEIKRNKRAVGKMNII